VTTPSGADLYQAVLPGGAVTFMQLFETYYGSGIPQQVTGVTITITPAGSATPLLGPTGTGITTGDGMTFTYQWLPAVSTPPGDCLVTWTATGESGTVTYTQAVTVAAPPSPVPAPGVYATLAQYQGWSGDSYTPANKITITLRRASEVIDRAMIGASYRTDADSMPTDPGIIDVFMRATCAQCEFMLANNDLANVKSQYSYTSQGGMQVSRGSSAQGQYFPPLAPAAAQILHTAGALPGAPLLGW
jgi:hypothetical protein